MLQVKTDHLLCPELVRFFQRHVLKIRIVQTAVEAPPCFGDDLCKQIVFGLIDLKMPFLKKLHSLILTAERDDHQVGGNFSGSLYRMKFIGWMKQKITLFQDQVLRTRRNAHFSFIDTDKFPEIMGFSLKRKGVHIFKIMNTENFINGYRIFQMNTVVTHCVLLYVSNCFK